MTQNKLKKRLDYHLNGGFIYKCHRSSKACKGMVVFGTKETNGYKSIFIEGRKYLFHRMIFLWHHGYLPKYIDHIDRNKYNNKIENLRPTTISLNGANRKINKTSKSGYKGVHWNNFVQHWVASIKKNKKRIYIGRFNKKEDAARAYNI